MEVKKLGESAIVLLLHLLLVFAGLCFLLIEIIIMGKIHNNLYKIKMIKMIKVYMILITITQTHK